MTIRNYRGAAIARSMLAASFILLAGTQQAYADQSMQQFSERSIQGRWGFSGESGMIVPPAVPQPVPTAAVGVVEFDGKGGCTVTSTINVNGTIVGPLTSVTCSYTVNPDGTGTSVAEFAGQPLSTVAFVIVDHAREIRFLNTTAIVAGFSAKRQ